MNMKTIDVEVKMRKDGKNTVVDVCPIDVYTTEEELTEKFSLEQILAMCNAQNRANITNKVRSSHREKTAGKGKRREYAFNCLPTVQFNDGKTGLEKLNEICALSDEDARSMALTELLETPEVQAAVDEKLAAA
jgi:hypothetical protein